MSSFVSLFQDAESGETRYRPDPLGRVGQGEWEAASAADPEDQAAQFDQFRDSWGQGAGLNDLFGGAPFELGDSVGTGGRNRRPDVAKVQTFLGRTGHLDLDRTEGPTGYMGTPVDQAIRDFQKDNHLTVDGILLPKGETIGALKGILSGESEGQPKSPQPVYRPKSANDGSSHTLKYDPSQDSPPPPPEPERGDYIRDPKTGISREKTEAEKRAQYFLANDKADHDATPAAPEAPSQPSGSENWPPAQGQDYDGPSTPPPNPIG